MNHVTVFVRSRRLTLLAVVALEALVLLLLSRALGHGGAEVVADSAARSGWKTIEYQGVRVDIPQDWERSDRIDCEFHAEHWGPPKSAGCSSDEGVAFYLAATFDPAHGPGVRHADPHGAHGPVWSGWTSAGGEYDVYAAALHREVVTEVLDSVGHG